MLSKNITKDKPQSTLWLEKTISSKKNISVNTKLFHNGSPVDELTLHITRCLSLKTAPLIM